MGVFKRREFLKGVGAVFLGQILIAKSVQAQEKEQDWFKTINRAANPDNLTATEKKHAPVIGIPGYVKTNQV
ncbi:MAG TPA: hypothetical protein ACFYED_06345, partial [Candidatus Tripitaka californicus]